jgi:hypothetical protein
MRVKKDAVLPGLRVTKEFAERVYRAMEMLGSDLSEVRRKLWEDYIRIAESGESYVRINPLQFISTRIRTFLHNRRITNEPLLQSHLATRLKFTYAPVSVSEWVSEPLLCVYQQHLQQPDLPESA